MPLNFKNAGLAIFHGESNSEGAIKNDCVVNCAIVDQ